MSEDRRPPPGAGTTEEDVVPYEADSGDPTEALTTVPTHGSTAVGGGDGRAFAPTSSLPTGSLPPGDQAGRDPREAAPAGPGRGTVPRPLRTEPRPTASRTGTRRRARLAVTRVDPWSVFLLSLLVSLFLAVVLVVAVAVLYALLDSLGVLSSIDTFAGDLQLIDPGETVLGAGRVLGIAAVVAAVNVVLLTVLATLAAFLYNVCASLTGGVEVVLAERD